MGQPFSSLPAGFFPAAALVLTQKAEIFQALYHSPEQFASLPDWVAEYINLKQGVYVKLFKAELTAADKDCNTFCHEFTHLISAEVLGLPVDFLVDHWPTWLHEAFAVAINQPNEFTWLAKQKLNPDVILPSLFSINEKGLFYHDSRNPQENVAYQYCYQFAKIVAVNLAKKKYPYVQSFHHPFGAFLLLAHESFYSKQDFTSALLAAGVNLSGLDLDFRRRFEWIE